MRGRDGGFLRCATVASNRDALVLGRRGAFVGECGGEFFAGRGFASCDRVLDCLLELARARGRGSLLGGWFGFLDFGEDGGGLGLRRRLIVAAVVTIAVKGALSLLR